MAISSIQAMIPCDIHRVWQVVTAVENYGWRSDLSRTEILNDRQFVEYAENGYATTFTVTFTAPPERWEFDMENTRMKGHWTGIFIQRGCKTEINFTEEVTAKRRLLKPFVRLYLKRQQAQFVSDLRKALS